MNMSGAYQNPIYNQQMQQYGQQYAYNPYMNQPRIDNTQNENAGKTAYLRHFLRCG